MRLFQSNEGERIIIQFGNKELKLDGYVAGLEDGCVKIAEKPDGTGTIRYVPWPNPNVAYIGFGQHSGGVF